MPLESTWFPTFQSFTSKAVILHVISASHPCNFWIQYHSVLIGPLCVQTKLLTKSTFQDSNIYTTSSIAWIQSRLAHLTCLGIILLYCLTVLGVISFCFPPKCSIVSNNEKTLSFNVGIVVLKLPLTTTMHCASLWCLWKQGKHLSEGFITHLAAAKFSSVVNHHFLTFFQEGFVSFLVHHKW